MKTKNSLPASGKTCGCADACGSGLERRDFLKLAAWGAAASLVPAMPVMAGPFETPISKTDSRRQEARSRLGAIAHCPRRGDRLSRRGAGKDRHARRRHLRRATLSGRRRQALALGHFQPAPAAPATATTPIRPSPAPRWSRVLPFAIVGGEQDRVSPARSPGFSDIAFAASIPIGQVEYRDAAVPVAVSLEAFSPFIPLNAGRFAPAGHDDAVHGEETRPRKSRSASWSAGCKTPSCLYTARSGPACGTNRIRRDAPLLLLRLRRCRRRTRSTSRRGRHRFRGFSERDLRRLGSDRHGVRPRTDPQVADSRLPGRRRLERAARGQFPRLAPGDSVEAKDARPERSPASRSSSSGTSSTSGSAAATIPARPASIC